MTNWNVSLFELLNASGDASVVIIAIAKLFAVYVVFFVPVAVAAAWLWGGEALKRSALEATVAGVLALIAARLIGVVYFHPRPFAVGLGRKFIEHAADSSFPSNHVTLMAAVGLSLMLRGESRALGGTIVVLALPVAWARVYLGVHFPADMVGALIAGAIAAISVHGLRRTLLEPTYNGLRRAYTLVLGPFIRRGWIRG